MERPDVFAGEIDPDEISAGLQLLRMILVLKVRL
jgi:hypothetical protein